MSEVLWQALSEGDAATLRQLASAARQEQKLILEFLADVLDTTRLTGQQIPVRYM